MNAKGENNVGPTIRDTGIYRQPASSTTKKELKRHFETTANRPHIPAGVPGLRCAADLLTSYLHQLNGFFDYTSYLECVSSYLSNTGSYDQLIQTIQRKQRELDMPAQNMRSLIFRAFYRSISHLPYSSTVAENNYRAVMTSKIDSFIDHTIFDKQYRKAAKSRQTPQESCQRRLAMHGFIIVMFAEADGIQNRRKLINNYAKAIPESDRAIIVADWKRKHPFKRGLANASVAGRGTDLDAFTNDCANYIIRVAMEIQEKDRLADRQRSRWNQTQMWSNTMIDQVRKGKKSLICPFVLLFIRYDD